MKKHMKSEDGFTLVEMIAVLVIIAVLAAVAVPSMSGFIKRAQMDSYIAEARLVCTALQKYLTEMEAEDGFISDAKVYEEIGRYDIGDKRNALSKLLEGNCTENGRIINIMYLYDKLDGIEYNVDGYVVTIMFNNEVKVEKEDKFFGK
ncbi:type II secretion system protein [Clostridium sp. MCC353]|uniref:pilus assembly FimT family protein n=1 Tax=Clostridium sp. MCC353 TaxID=2592646 RepID=UPI001C028666|nr:type II secretion system protein [Clostridium sp. MCC353]